MNNPAMEANVYMHHQKQMQVEEFPERPGEPECSYFLKTGDCKFKSNCKFHHPKNRIARLPPCSLSDKGLPLRPVSYFILLFFADMETVKFTRFLPHLFHYFCLVSLFTHSRQIIS